MGEQDLEGGHESACGEKVLGRYNSAGAWNDVQDCNEVDYTAIDARGERSRRFKSNKGVIAGFVLLVVKADVECKEIETRKMIRANGCCTTRSVATVHHTETRWRGNETRDTPF